jgi:hypothetical protein
MSVYGGLTIQNQLQQPARKVTDEFSLVMLILSYYFINRVRRTAGPTLPCPANID